MAYAYVAGGLAACFAVRLFLFSANLPVPTLRLATRASTLALCQAELVRNALLAAHPGMSVELLPIITSGDRAKGASLAALGGKGLFVKELEQALLEGRADLAVHSLKDVPSELPAPFAIAAVLERGDVRDALVSRDGAGLAELPDGARVASSSLRRQCQLLAARPQLSWQPIRGNLPTRLEKLKRGECDVLVLAVAGLQRLQLAGHITEHLAPDVCLPAAGQGALAIEILQDSEQAAMWAAPLHHDTAATRVEAERALCRHLGADCEAPLGALAEILADGSIRLRAVVGSPDGGRLLRAERQGSMPGRLGRELAQELLANGAKDFPGIRGGMQA